MPAKGRCTVLQILSISYSLFPLITFKTKKMKKFLGTITCVMLTLIVFAQSTKVPVKGIIKDATTHAPLAGALIQLGKVSTLSDESGQFIFGKIITFLS
jgi:hypothetical protein